MSEEVTLDDFAENSHSNGTQTDSTELRVGPFEFSLPPEWDTASLSEACENKDGDRVPVKKSKRESMNGEIPYYGASGQIDSVDDFLFDERLLLLAEDGANLLTRSSPIAYIIEGKSWVNNHAHVLKPNEGHDIYYLSEFLELLDYEPFVTGTAQPKLTQNSMGFLRVPKPSLSEQRKIATVLYTVDRAIEKTEEIIEQTKRVKTGVSQHYFEDYDTIRREENPESVEMVELSNLVDFKPGKAWKTDNLSEEGLKVVRISNLTGEKDDYWRYNGDYEERRVIEAGDLLFSWAGMKSSIGVHIYRGEKALLNQHIYNLEPKSSIGRKYLYYYLDYRMSDLYSLSQGGAVQIHLTKDIIERILIPKVSPEKQESIVAHLSEIDNALQNEITRKNRLKRLKRGLMQDLLSGTVRTTDTNIEIPEEITQHG